MSNKKEVKELIGKWFLEIFKKAASFVFITIVFIVSISLFLNISLNISLKTLIKDYLSKEFGNASYLVKKIDEEMYSYNSYNGFDRNKMTSKTDNYINKYMVENIGRELSFLEGKIDNNSLMIYKSLYKDFHLYYFDLIFNKFEYDKDKALRELASILLKYRCSLEKANQKVFSSSLEKETKKNFLRKYISKKIKTLLVETMVHTKSISIDEFNRFKEKNNSLDKDEMWNRLVIQYTFNLMDIARGGVCEENVFKKE